MVGTRGEGIGIENMNSYEVRTLAAASVETSSVNKILVGDKVKKSVSTTFVDDNEKENGKMIFSACMEILIAGFDCPPDIEAVETVTKTDLRNVFASDPDRGYETALLFVDYRARTA